MIDIGEAVEMFIRAKRTRVLVCPILRDIYREGLSAPTAVKEVVSPVRSWR